MKQSFEQPGWARRLAPIALIAALSLLATFTACLAVEDGVRAAIESDWLRQEQRRDSDPAQPAALERVVRRGRFLADDLQTRGAAEAARRARSTLDSVEQRARTVLEQSRRADAGGPEGFHLVGAAVGGGGADLDSDRMNGKDWAYSPDDSAKLGGLRTLSWDDQEVLYRFRDLRGDATHRLRLVFANNTRRAQAVAVNGRELDRFVLEAWRVTERWLEVPREAAAGGELEVGIRTTGTNNVIVSGIEVWASRPPADPALAARLEARREALAGSGAGRVPALRTLYLEARWAVRELAFANPLLDFDSIVFVRRHWPSIGHQCAHRVGETQQPGATLCVLTGLQGDGEVRDVLAGQLSPGGVGRFDLSFDARRIVFPYAAAREQPEPYSTGFGLVPSRFRLEGGPDDARAPRGGSGNRGGSCYMYDVYEIGVDGSGLRKVAGRDYAEDTEPCYLPDGRILFTSSRDGRLVQCGDWALVNALYTVGPDGSDPRRITEPKEGEFYPSLLDDGRIVYTRWDYVMKPFNMIQQLWTVYPDGRGAELAYGDHYTFSRGPIAFFEARQVPGTSWVVCNGAAHHNTGGGPVMLVDLSRNRGGPEGMRNLTPEVGYPERGPAGMGGWFASPYPLAMEHFLVVYSMEDRDNAPHGYGLYLFDAFGNLELIYRDPNMSVYSPMPLRPRPRPPSVPDAVSDLPASTPATVFVRDVYAGLEGVPRGTVKYLRVLESHDKQEYCRLMFLDLGLKSGTDPRSVVGEVPVESDGSVAVELAPRRNYFFELVDANHLEIRRMKNYLTLQPGETRGCVGCHDHGSAVSSVGALPLALRKPPPKPTPPPWGSEPIDFRHVVQPVLDRHCVRCHDGSDGKDKSFDLRGLQWVDNRGAYSYGNLPNLQFRFSDSYRALMPHVRIDPVGNYDGAVTPMRPYAVGSAVSPLMKLLKAGHHGVDLPAADWLALACWIDCNAPFYGGWDEVEYVPHTATPSTPQERAERRASLGAAAYLDLGSHVSDGDRRFGPELRLETTRFGGYEGEFFRGEAPAPRRHATHVFSRRPIRLRAHGLDPARPYRLGVSWWDYDAQRGVQSVIVETFDGERRFPLLSQKELPAWKGRSQPPAEHTAAIPPEAYADGRLKIVFAGEPGKETVLGEMWLLESAMHASPHSRAESLNPLPRQALSQQNPGDD